MIEWRGDGLVHVRPFLTVTLGILALFAGKALTERLAILQRYSIPEPVTGGLLFCVAFGLTRSSVGVELDFALTARDVLLVYFFTTIGLNARASDLLAGGRPLAILLALTLVALILQNSIGTSLAALFGLPLAEGLIAGSISLVGGLGTAIAWAPTLAASHGVERALEAGIACATVGLVAGAIMGGPVAEFLIRRHRLSAVTAEDLSVGVRSGGPTPEIDYFAFLRSLLAIHVAVMAGILLQQGLAALNVTMPLFVMCLAAGIVLANVVPRVAPRIAWPSHTPALALIAEVSLGIFLAMSLMAMQPWKLGAGVGWLLFVLAAQVVALLVFVRFVVFPALGRSYDAALVSAGFFGFAIGTMPTAMANMAAVTQRHGASPLAFWLVPIVGAFFVDLANAAVIQASLAVLAWVR